MIEDIKTPIMLVLIRQFLASDKLIYLHGSVYHLTGCLYIKSQQIGVRVLWDIGYIG